MLASSSDPEREFGELRSRASMRSYLAVSSIAIAINNECFVMVLIDETSCEMVLNETLHEKRTKVRVRSGQSSLRERVRSKCCKHTVSVLRGWWVGCKFAGVRWVDWRHKACARERGKDDGRIDSRGIVAGSKLRGRHSFLVKLAYLRKLR